KRLLGRAENFIAWDPATGKELQRFPNVHEHLRGRLELSRDESLFVGPDPTGKKILMWSATTARILGSIEPEGGVLLTMLTPDGRRLVTWGEQMLVWDVETRHVLHSLSANREKGWPRAMSSDSRWLVSATIEPRGAPSI